MKIRNLIWLAGCSATAGVTALRCEAQAISVTEIASPWSSAEQRPESVNLQQVPAAAISPAPTVGMAPLNYRLEIWGDLFTPQEMRDIKSLSDVLDLARDLDRSEPSASIRDSQVAQGSAYATAISWSLVFGGEDSEFAGNSPSRWVQPGLSTRNALEQQSILSIAHWMQNSRESGSQNGAATNFLTKLAAIMPLPHHGLGTQAEFTGVRIGVMSLLSGNWPNPAKMDQNFGKAATQWVKGAAMATLATGLGSLLASRSETTISGVTLRRDRAMPINLFDEAF